MSKGSAPIPTSARISVDEHLRNSAVLGIDVALVESDQIPDGNLKHSSQRPACCARSVESKNICHEVETTQQSPREVVGRREILPAVPQGWQQLEAGIATERFRIDGLPLPWLGQRGKRVVV